LAIVPDLRAFPLFLFPRRVLRGVYVGRLILATSISVAAIIAWLFTRGERPTFVFSVFVVTLFFTAYSAFETEIRRRSITLTFSYVQVLFDLLLVTAAVQVTWGSSHSDFAPLYILVIVTSAVLLPSRGAILTAALADVVYLADSIWGHPTTFDAGVSVQLLIFTSVALGSGYIVSKLRQAGASQMELAVELAAFHLQKRDIEELRDRAKRLEAVAELSASMAHEIRNPLASIRSAAEQLASGERVTEDERTLSRLVQRESDRLSRLLGEFLEFAKPGITKSENVDLAQSLTDAVSAAQHQAEDGVRIEMSVSATGLFVNGDGDLLHRALLNLLLNALQASPPNGVVRAEAGELTKSQVPSSKRFETGAVAIRVVDHGPGISAEVRERIFDPFVTSRPGGTGLGLSVVHRAIEAHGGFVHVDSDQDGSRFTVVLPKARD
jgi:two-component system sensor histidine kinase HydH